VGLHEAPGGPGGVASFGRGGGGNPPPAAAARPRGPRLRAADRLPGARPVGPPATLRVPAGTRLAGRAAGPGPYRPAVRRGHRADRGSITAVAVIPSFTRQNVR